MAQKGPGKTHRKGISLMQVVDMFGDNEKSPFMAGATTLERKSALPALRFAQCEGRCSAKSMTHRCNDCPKKSMFTAYHPSI